AVRKQSFAMDQIAAAIRYEGVLAKFLREGVAAVNHDAGRAAEITGGPSAAFDGAWKKPRHAPARAKDAPRFIGAEAVDRRRGAVGGDVHRGGRHCEKRIARGVAVFIHHLADVGAVAANKFAPTIVEAQAVLPAAALPPHRQGARVEGEIVAAQLERVCGAALALPLGPRSGNSNASGLSPCAGELAVHQTRLAAVAAVCRVDAIVQAPGEAV